MNSAFGKPAPAGNQMLPPTAFPASAPISSAGSGSVVVGSGADAGAGAGSPKAAKNDKDGVPVEASSGFFSFAASSLIDGLMRSLPEPSGEPRSEPPLLSPVASATAPQIVASVASGASPPVFGHQGGHRLESWKQADAAQSSSATTGSIAERFMPRSLDTSTRSGVSSTQGVAQQDPAVKSASNAGMVGGGMTETIRSIDGSGSLVAVEQRIAKLEESLKGFEGVLKERQNDSGLNLPECEEQLKQLATKLSELQSGRKSLEERSGRIQSSISMERDEREAWLRAFKAALGKSLTDLDTCVDHSIAESSKAMLDRLGSADSMMLKLINRVDQIQWARESVSRIQSGSQSMPRIEAESQPSEVSAKSLIERLQMPDTSVTAKDTFEPAMSPRQVDRAGLSDPTEMARQMMNKVMSGLKDRRSRSPIGQGFPASSHTSGPGTPQTLQHLQMLDHMKGAATLAHQTHLRHTSDASANQTKEVTKEAETSDPGNAGKRNLARSLSPPSSDQNVAFPMESAKLLQDWTDVFNENLRLQQVRSGLINQRRKQRTNISHTSKSVGASPAMTPDQRKGTVSLGASPSATPKNKDLRRRINKIMAGSPRAVDGSKSGLLSKSRSPGPTQAPTSAGSAERPSRPGGGHGSMRLPTVAEQPVGSANVL